MHATLLLCAGALLQQTVVASIGLPVHRSLSLRQDDGGDDGGDDGDNPNYFEQVCFPDFNDDSDTLTVSTPCEALELLEFECQANGGLPILCLIHQSFIANQLSNRFRNHRLHSTTTMYLWLRFILRHVFRLQQLYERYV